MGAARAGLHSQLPGLLSLRGAPKFCGHIPSQVRPHSRVIPKAPSGSSAPSTTTTRAPRPRMHVLQEGPTSHPATQHRACDPRASWPVYTVLKSSRERERSLWLRPCSRAASLLLASRPCSPFSCGRIFKSFKYLKNTNARTLPQTYQSPWSSPPALGINFPFIKTVP